MAGRIILTAVTAALFVAAGVMSCNGSGGKDIQTDKTEQTEQTQQAVQTPVPDRTLTITAVGDCTLATDINASKDAGFVGYAEKNGTEYFLSEVKDVFAEDDLTIVNFEGTLSDRGERENKQFAFRGKPEYVETLTSASVEAANLANNHSSDYGKVSLEDTKEILDEAGILNCRGVENVSVSEINGIQVGLVGINYLNDQMKTELEDAIEKAKDMGAEIVILSIHWGAEKATKPSDEQTEAAYRAIDCGADLVIGTHPHVLQGIEKYKGRYICYSLGNFCFGGNSNPSDKDSAMFRQTFTLTADGLKDDDSYEIIPCRISGADGYNDYRPVIATGEKRANIESKLSAYSKDLGMTGLKFREVE